jgi:hypothetical protein
MNSQSEAAINSLMGKNARLEFEKAELQREVKKLRDNANTHQCPSCHRSYPVALPFWPGYLIPGELRCTACYSADN